MIITLKKLLYYLILTQGPEDKTWQKGPQFDWSLRDEPLTLRGLKSSTQYQIRAVLLENGGEGNFGDQIPVLTAKTSCLPLGK
jgi:hypothetical protein